MATTITGVLMTSDQTRQWAVAAGVITPGSGYWHISWLPGDGVSREQAITAMTLAEVVATCDVSPEGRWWPFVEGWAAELHLAPQQAVDLLTAVA